MKNGPFHQRLSFALKGIREAFRTERSMRTHAGALALVVVLLLATRPEPVWWALLLLAAGLVGTAELINCALEALADRVSLAVDPLIGRAKDCAAGAVLVALSRPSPSHWRSPSTSSDLAWVPEKQGDPDDRPALSRGQSGSATPQRDFASLFASSFFLASSRALPYSF